MKIIGTLKKMISDNQNPIDYFLNLDQHIVHVNQLIGQKIKLKHIGFECLNCHEDKPIFRQGFCKKCFFESAKVGDWIMKPELSKAHLNIEDRDLEYEKQMQLKPHVVYLANSSNLKVGVTRQSQIPTRWIDQGAESAILVLKVPNRYLAGIAEISLKEYVADKTNWRKMLTSSISEIDLIEEKRKLKNYLPDEVKPYYVENDTVYNFTFPIDNYPDKVTSINLKKLPDFEKSIIGIKGQYLIFEDHTVFNVRSNEGYVIELTT